MLPLVRLYRGLRARPVACLLGLLSVGTLGFTPVQRWVARRPVAGRIAALPVSPHAPREVAGCAGDSAFALAAADSPGALASWQNIGGCGAGASTGVGGGIKWIGRGVTGGAFDSQCTASYTRLA